MHIQIIVLHDVITILISFQIKEPDDSTCWSLLIEVMLWFALKSNKGSFYILTNQTLHALWEPSCGKSQKWDERTSNNLRLLWASHAATYPSLSPVTKAPRELNKKHLIINITSKNLWEEAAEWNAHTVDWIQHRSQELDDVFHPWTLDDTGTCICHRV